MSRVFGQVSSVGTRRRGRSLCTERSGHILERETVGVSVFVVSVDAERNL